MSFVYVTDKEKLMMISISVIGEMRINKYNVYLYISGY